MMHVLLIAQDILDYSVEYANAVAASARVTLIAPAGRFRAQAAFVDPAIDLAGVSIISSVGPTR